MSQDSPKEQQKNRLYDSGIFDALSKVINKMHTCAPESILEGILTEIAGAGSKDEAKELTKRFLKHMYLNYSVFSVTIDKHLEGFDDVSYPIKEAIRASYTVAFSAFWYTKLRMTLGGCGINEKEIDFLIKGFNKQCLRGKV